MTQAEALNILKTGASVFLTGEPGSGKTYVVNKLVEYLREHELEPAITASTGIAATHIGGMTIHSWSGIGIKDNLNSYDLDFLSEKETLVKRINKTSTLIIDEISMLDARVLDMVDLVCRTVRRSREPFGGLQVILVGDFFQLPPVSRGENTKRFAFESKVWKDLNPFCCYLSEQHRQSDTMFLNVLSAVRTNSFSEEQGYILESRVGKHEDLPHTVTRLYSHNEDVDRINTDRLSKVNGESRLFTMSSKGAKPLIEGLKRGCLSPENLHLKVGASVMFTKNNPGAGFVNGTLGEVESFDTTTTYPIIRTLSGELIQAEPMEWAVEENGKVRAKIIQIPLRLAWAITIHKSQGMSMDAAVMDLSQVFEFGQGYVALSRVRSLSGLYLLGANQKAFTVHPDIVKKDAEFKALSDSVAYSFSDMPEKEVKTMQDNFLLACGGTIEKSTSKKGESKSSLGSTYDQTHSLIREAETFQEISKAREVGIGTVLSHIEHMMSAGRIKYDDIEHLITACEIPHDDVGEILSAFEACETDKLKPVYERLGGTFDYDTLRVVRFITKNK